MTETKDRDRELLERLKWIIDAQDGTSFVYRKAALTRKDIRTIIERIENYD